MIAGSRPANKNVSTGAVIRAKCGTEPGAHKLLETTLRATMQSVTERQTDRIHDDVNSRSDCVVVRSAKKYHFKIFNVALVLDIFSKYIAHDIQIHM